jgi:peptidoglycan/xylan/chitin deacetylase (PgdA/CDA1 family)
VAVVGLALLVAGCAPGPTRDQPGGSATPSPTPSPTVAPWQESRQWVHELGDDESISAARPITEVVHFPKTGISVLDDAINSWVQDQLNKVQQAISSPSPSPQSADASAEADDPSEQSTLTVDYDSFDVPTGYSSVLLLGWLTGPLADLLPPIAAEFSVDKVNMRLLEPKQILSATAQPQILDLLKKKLEANGVSADALSAVDGSWLSTVALAKDGVTVVVQPHEGVPGQTVNLTRAELGDAYLLPAEAIKDQPPVTAPTGKLIALTFDDGPGQGASSIMQTLAENGAKATFFNLGWRVQSNPGLAAEIVKAGNQIGNHTWDHPDLTKLDANGVRTQFGNTQNVIESATGVRPHVCRPPYGAVNDTVKAIAAEEGCAIVNWSVDPDDWKLKDAQKVHDAVMSHVKPGSIVLMHDIYTSSADAVKLIVPELKAQGYTMVTIDELFAAQGGVQPGQVYSHA